MNLVTAKSYEGYDIVKQFEKNGKPYAIVKKTCDRCYKGVYVTRVENNQPVPHPAYNGVCLKCGGAGFIQKEVRLYTQEERDRMDIKAEKDRVTKEAQKDAEMRSKAVLKLTEWKQNNGFSAENLTYAPTGNTFAIKDELKAEGYKYDPVIGWHIGTPIEREHIILSFDEVYEATAWGEAKYKIAAADYVRMKKKSIEPVCNSEWIGEEGEKISDLVVTLDKISGCETRFGWTNIYTFKNNDNILIWFTKSNVNAEVGAQLYLSGTVKKHDTYDDRKQTVLTRVKIKEA